MSECVIPFGLLFLERAIAYAGGPPHRYDEDRDVSVFQMNGEWVPLVSATDPRMGTETITEVAGESTDEASPFTNAGWWLSTDTETKAQEDLTAGAPEPHLVTALATDTETRTARDETH